MQLHIFFVYLLIMAGSTYLIRTVPFALVREKIENRFVRSFLYYIPYAVLTAMTLPAGLYVTDYFVSAQAGVTVAVIFARWGKGLITVAVAACAAVYVVELFWAG